MLGSLVPFRPPVADSVSSNFLVCRVKTRSRLILCAILLASFSTVAQAHPGHDEVGPSHYLTSPQHLGELGLVIALGVAAKLLLSRRLKDRVNAQ
jgi:hypothetical protein